MRLRRQKHMALHFTFRDCFFLLAYLHSTVASLHFTVTSLTVTPSEVGKMLRFVDKLMVFQDFLARVSSLLAKNEVGEHSEGIGSGTRMHNFASWCT